MDEEVVISRLNIVRKVDMDTPLCVLEEILDAHGVRHQKGIVRKEYRKELLDYIHKLPPIILNPPVELQN